MWATHQSKPKLRHRNCSVRNRFQKVRFQFQVLTRMVEHELPTEFFICVWSTWTKRIVEAVTEFHSILSQRLGIFSILPCHWLYNRIEYIDVHHS
uniref:Uncharacterized protein n=1 Tax=Rhizophora mucronata TaxID=61149 RepID=A0A2P2P6L4_RHIMU